MLAQLVALDIVQQLGGRGGRVQIGLWFGHQVAQRGRHGGRDKLIGVRRGPGARAARQAAQVRDQVARHVRLGQHALNVQKTRPLAVQVGLWRHDDRQVRLDAPQVGDQLHHVQLGHLEIEHGDVVPLALERVFRGGSIGRHADAKLAGAFERLLEAHHETDIGIDD